MKINKGERVMKSVRNMSTHSLAAKMIKAELKKLFPKTKFSVRSQEYTGATAVDVDWFDGPSIPVIEEIIKKYTKGDSDGKANGYPQVRYASTRRDITASLCGEVFELIKSVDPVLAHAEDLYSGMTPDQAFQIDGPSPYLYIIRRLRQMDLTNGFKVEDFLNKSSDQS